MGAEECLMWHSTIMVYETHSGTMHTLCGWFSSASCVECLSCRGPPVLVKVTCVSTDSLVCEGGLRGGGGVSLCATAVGCC